MLSKIGGLTICAACGSAPTPTPIIHTVVKPVEVTQEIIVEVTRLVEIPVTLTPTATPDYTATPL